MVNARASWFWLGVLTAVAGALSAGCMVFDAKLHAEHDEDGDGIPDSEDPCPHIAGNAADADGDGVGDACDPRPAVPSEHWQKFEGFGSLGSSIVAFGMAVVNDALDAPTAAFNCASPACPYAFLPIQTGESKIIAAGKIIKNAATTSHSVTFFFGFDAAQTSFHIAGLFDDSSLGISGLGILSSTPSVMLTPLAGSTFMPALPEGDWSIEIDESVKSQHIRITATVGGVTQLALDTPTSTLIAGQGVGIFVVNTELTIDYVGIMNVTP